VLFAGGPFYFRLVAGVVTVDGDLRQFPHGGLRHFPPFHGEAAALPMVWVGVCLLYSHVSSRSRIAGLFSFQFPIGRNLCLQFARSVVYHEGLWICGSCLSLTSDVQSGFLVVYTRMQELDVCYLSGFGVLYP